MADVSAVADSVEESGAEIVDPLSPGEFGPEFTVRDPDGYLLTFHETGGAGSTRR